MYYVLRILTLLCRHQGVGGFGNEGPAFGFMNPDQQLAGRVAAPAPPHPSVGGNPFG